MTLYTSILRKEKLVEKINKSSTKFSVGLTKFVKKTKTESLNLFKNWRLWIFIMLFLALFGTFFNHKEQFVGDKLLDQLFYGNKVTNIIGTLFLLMGWLFWELAIGKRKSNVLAAFAFLFFIIAMILICNLLSFIGIGITLFIMIPVMIWVLKPIKVQEMKKKICNFWQKKN